MSPKEFLRLIRFPNLVMIALSQYLAARYLAGMQLGWESLLGDPRFFLLSLSTVLSAAGGYVINDYYDVKIDLVNKPGRVVVGKTLRRRRAFFLHLCFSALSVGIGFYLSPRFGLAYSIAATALWLYSAQLKQRPFIGNFVVAALAGLSLILVSEYAGGWPRGVTALAFFGFFTNLLREIVKDMEDMEGDARFGCRTLPIVWGIRKTKKAVYALVALFLIALSVYAWQTGGTSLYAFALLTWPLTAFFLNQTYRAHTPADYARLSLYCKLMMLLGTLWVIVL